MKALVLAGGFPQIQLIKELKKRGIIVLLADYYEEPVAKKYADSFYNISTLDIEAIKDLAQKENVDFIITVCTDQALLTVAKVSEELGLPCYIDYKTALNVTNKQYMKRKFVENNIPTAKFVISDTLNERIISGFDYPLIVKPVDCNSSKGVVKVTDYNELEEAFLQDIKYSRTHTAIVEEFIEGTEITVDAYIEDGETKLLSVSENQKINDSSKFVIFRQFNPAPVSEKCLDSIKTIIQNIATSFELENSPLLVQMLIKNEQPYVVEFSARTGGGVKYILIKNASGFDVINSVIDLTLGDKPHCEVVAPANKYFVNEHIYCKPGVFDHLEGFEELKKNGTIIDYYLYKWKGAVIDSIANSGDRICGFTIVGNSVEDINEKHKIVNDTVKVIDTNGTDMARHDLMADIM